MLYSFDRYCVDVKSRELRTGEALIEVEPQVFDLLVYLIENRDKVVSKEELLRAIWGGRVSLGIRPDQPHQCGPHAVGDTGAKQNLIRTSARKGYRFVGLLNDGTRSSEPVRPEASARTAPGGALLYLRRRSAHRLCNSRRGHAAGQGRQLAEPSGI